MCLHCGFKGWLKIRRGKCPHGKAIHPLPIIQGTHTQMHARTGPAWLHRGNRVYHAPLCWAWRGSLFKQRVWAALPPACVHLRGAQWGALRNECARGAGRRGVDMMNNLTRKEVQKLNVLNLPPLTPRVCDKGQRGADSIYTAACHFSGRTRPQQHWRNSFSHRVFICKSRFSYGMRRRPSHFKTFFVHDSFSWESRREAVWWLHPATKYSYSNPHSGYVSH